MKLIKILKMRIDSNNKNFSLIVPREAVRSTRESIQREDKKNLYYRCLFDETTKRVCYDPILSDDFE